MDKQNYNYVATIEELEDGRFYRVGDLTRILKGLGVLFSIYTIRDYETWKCLDYKCGKRHNHPVEKCEVCGGEVRSPLIDSPRTRGGGKGPGHRRYTADEVRKIVAIFRERA